MEAVLTSVQVAVVATAISLVLGTLISLALQRFTSSAATRSACWSSCRSRCPASSPVSRSTTSSAPILGVPLSICDRRHRARHLLHRDGVQQRDRPAAAHRARTSRRRRPTSAPGIWTTFRLVTFPQLRSALLAGRPARLRAELRRDHRHHIHRRVRRDDAADLDPEQHVPAEPGADRQRRSRWCWWSSRSCRSTSRSGSLGRTGWSSCGSRTSECSCPARQERHHGRRSPQPRADRYPPVCP